MHGSARGERKKVEADFKLATSKKQIIHLQHCGDAANTLS